jgi:hypothetical protein
MAMAAAIEGRTEETVASPKPSRIASVDIIHDLAAASWCAILSIITPYKLSRLDLGIGSDDYKRLFCKGDQPIFDSLIPLSPRDRLAAHATASLNRTKRLVKHNPALLEIAQNLRSMFR